MSYHQFDTFTVRVSCDGKPSLPVWYRHLFHILKSIPFIGIYFNIFSQPKDMFIQLAVTVIGMCVCVFEGVSTSSRTGLLERELQVL